MYKVIFVLSFMDSSGHMALAQTQLVEFETYDQAEAAILAGVNSRIAEVDVIRLYQV